MGKAERCEYRWASKECSECGHENDIAARYCENDKCKAELVNPNDKLNSTFATIYADPHALRTERVIDFKPKKSVSKAGNDVLIIDIVTDKNRFRVWYNYNLESAFIRKWGADKIKKLFSYTLNTEDFKNILNKDDSISFYLTRFHSTLAKHVSEESIADLEKLWNQKTRFYHNVQHLNQIITDIQYSILFGDLSVVEKHTLLLAAFFHDAIYDAKRKDNEDKSIEFFKKSYIGKDAIMVQKVSDLIEVTKYRKRPTEKLQKIMWDADNAGFKKGWVS